MPLPDYRGGGSDAGMYLPLIALAPDALYRDQDFLIRGHYARRKPSEP